MLMWCAWTQFAEPGMGITVVVSTFGNGTKGPLLVHVKDGHWPKAFIDKYNSDPAYKGRLRILTSGTDSHMMNAETTLQMMEQWLKPVPLDLH